MTACAPISALPLQLKQLRKLSHIKHGGIGRAAMAAVILRSGSEIYPPHLIPAELLLLLPRAEGRQAEPDSCLPGQAGLSTLPAVGMIS